MQQTGAGARYEVFWIGSSLKELRSFPASVRRQAGFLLGAVQRGAHPAPDVKTWKGDYNRTFEIRIASRGEAFRVIYTTRKADFVCVLHAFQKKSHDGDSTPREHIQTIHRRQQTVDTYFGQLK